jgi:serine/threonine protein kinase
MADDALTGSELGDYRIVRTLGRGGMGVVYEAEDLALRRPVALKVLAPAYIEDPTARTRFQREIDHAVAIEHPHVVPVYAAGFEPPHFYIAMRLIRGADLARHIRERGALEPDRGLRLLGQIASALHAVHASGRVHRDVKPHNVLVWGLGEDDEHAFLTDFGIAKALSESHGLTGMGAVGTPAYMAPEICLGRDASPASDQYSLGCLAFELLTGESPYDADGVSFADAHIGQEPKNLRQLLPGADPDLAAAIARALAKNPADRHADVREFVRATKAADDAFTQSQAISRVLDEGKQTGDAVGRLATEQRLSDARISQITELERTEVVRLRRKQARAALVGRRT